MKMQLEVFWEFIVRDARGKLVYRNREKANSCLGNFIGMCWVQMYAGDVGSICHAPVIDTTGAAQTPASNNNFAQNLGATTGQTDRSVVLGTGVTANGIDTRQLAALIAHGAGAGQLNYGNTTKLDPVIATNPRQFQISRLFGGNAVSAVVVQEAGLMNAYTNLGYSILIERTLITPFNIPALGAATAVATIQVSI